MAAAMNAIQEAEIRLAKLQLSLVKIEYRELCRKSFRAFVLHMQPAWQPAWFHFDLMAILQRIGDGEIKRAIISLPPGHAKSTYAQLFLAWCIGRDPDKRFISTAHTDSLTAINTRAVQGYIESDEYREIFPIYMSEQNNKLIKIGDHKGGLSSSGIMGGITGKRADGGILIDDPVKNFKGATSQAQKDTLEHEWQYSIRSRTQESTWVLLIMTRWRIDDFAGMRLQQAANDPRADQWLEFRFPLIKIDPTEVNDPREIGEPLWSAGGYGREWAAQTKATVPIETWESIYQQNPVVIGGGIIKTYNLRFWYLEGCEPPPVKLTNADGEIVEAIQIPLPSSLSRRIQSWDMTFKKTKSGSFVVGQVWGTGAPELEHAGFLLDQKRARVGFDDACDMVVDLCETHPWLECYFEDKANGPGMTDHLRGKVKGNIIEHTPVGDKEERAQLASPFVNGGNIYIPHPSIYEWVLDYIKELGAFPKGSNDDQVDATTQAIPILLGSAEWKAY